jgi:hypothetical protein
LGKRIKELEMMVARKQGAEVGETAVFRMDLLQVGLAVG